MGDPRRLRPGRGCHWRRGVLGAGGRGGLVRPAANLEPGLRVENGPPRRRSAPQSRCARAPAPSAWPAAGAAGAGAVERPRLREIRAGLETAGEPPSRRLRRLDTLVSMMQVLHNGVFVLVGLVLLWPMQLAIRLERWRGE